MKRAILLILDSVGIGHMPDAAEFGDKGANTLGNIYKEHPDMRLETLQSLGIANIVDAEYLEPVERPIGNFARLRELSNGKDTTTGHWEIAGMTIEEPFKTFPEGFPVEVISEFESRTGRKAIYNKPASGTVILEELGEHHMNTGDLIVYTSADSVFQIAAHEEVVPVEELYRYCEIAREILMGEYMVARVIARPFVGKPGAFERTPNRRDYSLSPFEDTVLDKVKEKGLDVIAVGKIVDIYNGKGITEDVHTKSNMDGMIRTIDYVKAESNGLIFTNLVDFDSKYGHRRNSLGYKEALLEVDGVLPELLSAMRDEDILIITADHGNDPTYKGTDHTRETVPMIIYGKSLKQGVDLGIRASFADIAATVAEYLEVEYSTVGKSFLGEVLLEE